MVKFQKNDFIGKEALIKQKEKGIKRRRVGIQMIDQGIPRKGFEIYSKNEKIGYITSGTFSPLLKCGIGMGYVKISQANEGNVVNVKIREKLAKSKIIKFPFYDPDKYGYKRRL